MGNRTSQRNEDNDIDQDVLNNISVNNSDVLLHRRELEVRVSHPQRNNNQNGSVRQCVAFNVDINIDKRSLGLVDNPANPNQYYLDFVFDAEKPCKITVYVCANEVRNANGQLLYFYVPEDFPNPNCYKFSPKLQQRFPKGAAIIDFNQYPQEKLFSFSDNFYPLVIVMQIDKMPRSSLISGSDLSERKQRSISQITYAHFKKEKNMFQVKVIKQKIIFNSHVFDVQDIFDGDYGVATETQRKECVVCFQKIQDTIVLPCRHLCLCDECTQIVRVQTNKCPICRTNVTSFVQFKLEGSELNVPE